MGARAPEVPAELGPLPAPADPQGRRGGEAAGAGGRPVDRSLGRSLLFIHRTERKGRRARSCVACPKHDGTNTFGRPVASAQTNLPGPAFLTWMVSAGLNNTG